MSEAVTAADRGDAENGIRTNSLLNPTSDDFKPGDSVNSTSTNEKAAAPSNPTERTDIGSVIARHESLISAGSLASVDRPPSEHLPPAKIYHPLSFSVIALLMPASIFGVLARLGLQALVTYDGESVFPLAYIQALGCFVMGMGLGMKEPLGKFYGPLYTAMTTGFCGSLTTFSGWQVDIFNSWINATGSQRDGLRDFIDGLTKTFVTLCLSLSSLWFGIHCCKLVAPHIPTIKPPSKPTRYTLTALAVLTYAATFPAYFHGSPSYRHQATAALLFSFPGTLSRYLLSVGLNPRFKLMPLGTFTANIFGTALLGLFHVLQGRPTPVSANACAILQGLGDGYCGCLTTVSTFATEVDALEGWKAWLYATASWVTAQLVLLVIMGSSFWSGHVHATASCKFAS